MRFHFVTVQTSIKRLGRALLGALFGVSVAGAFTQPTCALAQNDVLIEVDLGRTGRASDAPRVFQRAILSKSEQPTDTALMFYRGNPGIAQIRSVDDKSRNFPSFMRKNQHFFLEANIALVLMDCPTDMWNSCSESYRLSAEHADDTRSIMRVLKDQHGISNMYVMGHSMGASSSRGLARSLGNEIAGSIHSSAMNIAARNGFGASFFRFPYNSLLAPQLHVHNQNDACRSTPYGPVKEYAGSNLVTVKGGTAMGDPCGGGHLHSHQGREEVVVKAIISWIKTKKVDAVVGE